MNEQQIDTFLIKLYLQAAHMLREVKNTRNQAEYQLYVRRSIGSDSFAQRLLSLAEQFSNDSQIDQLEPAQAHTLATELERQDTGKIGNQLRERIASDSVD